MRAVYVADVEDGLCMAIRTLFGETIQIDCGSRQGTDVAFHGFMQLYDHFYSPDVFILSHFHVDHYNGLLFASRHSPPYHWRIKEVYYPRLPEFREKEKFMDYLSAINLRIFGSETGIMEYDFLEAISRINVRTFWYRPVSKGDIIDINGAKFEVLWPPTMIKQDETLSVIENALRNFEKAMEQDEKTKQLYERIKREGVFRRYAEGGKMPKSRGRENINRDTEKEYKEKELPAIVKKANKSLRKAANHLSLSLFEDNRLLFLGDIESFEIRQIVDYLNTNDRKKFYVFITPHHGTHWDDSLRGIDTFYSITSNSRKSCSKMNLGFKLISKKSFATSVNGDIIIPICLPPRLWRRHQRWFCDDEI